MAGRHIRIIEEAHRHQCADRTISFTPLSPPSSAEQGIRARIASRAGKMRDSRYTSKPAADATIGSERRIEPLAISLLAAPSFTAELLVKARIGE